MTLASQEAAIDKAQGNSSYATQHISATPARATIAKSRTSSQLCDDTFFTAQEHMALYSPERTQSIRRTRSGARDSSLTATTSASALCTSSPTITTPTRGLVDLSVKTNVTPHLDHVLSYHQKVSPTTFPSDAFTSFALDSDTPGSHDSGYSYFGNWRFYSSRVGDTSGGDVPPSSSDDLLLSDSDSSDQEHQINLLPRTYSAPMATRSVPLLFTDTTTGNHTVKTHMDPLARSMSLSALHGSENTATSIVTSSEHDHSRAFNMNSSQEAMRFACRSPDIQEANTTASSLDTFEFVGSLDSPARNGMRNALRSKMVVKPFKQLRKAVNKLLN